MPIVEVTTTMPEVPPLETPPPIGPLPSGVLPLAGAVELNVGTGSDWGVLLRTILERDDVSDMAVETSVWLGMGIDVLETVRLLKIVG